MPNWRMKAVLLASSVLAVGAMIGAPSTAQASVGQCGDESGNLCFWAGKDFTLSFQALDHANNDWRNIFVWLPGGCTNVAWNDCASSIRNEGLSCEAVVWSDINYKGVNFVINRDTQAANLTQWGRPDGGNWNDAISSNNWFC